MSLYGTMRTGVSGMNAQANRLGTVGENIANSSTVGYKKAGVQFSSMILPTTSGAYNSGGVETTVRYAISQQGTFSYTSSSTDLAVNGAGFFIVQGTDGTDYMTRAGSFVPMDDGTLQNAAGYTLMGYEYSSTSEDPTIVINGFDGLTPVNLASAGITATPSGAGTLQVNAPANEAIGFAKSTSLIAIDSQGNTRLLNFTYTKTAANTWTVSASYDNNGTAVSAMAAQTLTFGTDGKLLTPAAPSTVTTLPLGTAVLGGAVLPALTLDLTGTTQLAADFSVKGNIDGSQASTVKGYEIDADGIVSVSYSNGDLIPRYRVALANVQSPDNLRPIAGNLYTQSNSSGVVVLGYAGSSGFGEILSGALEDSNVDVAEELTGMIEAQRNYTANSKVFQTGSELMEVLVNLKR